jgi:hypothetical protein
MIVIPLPTTGKTGWRGVSFGGNAKVGQAKYLVNGVQQIVYQTGKNPTEAEVCVPSSLFSVGHPN